jgi:hypothetical protein
MCGAYGSGGGGEDDFGAQWVLVVESGDFGVVFCALIGRFTRPNSCVQRTCFLPVVLSTFRIDLIGVFLCLLLRPKLSELSFHLSLVSPLLDPLS